jgi:hypothetical protein
VAVTVDGASVSVSIDDATADVQEEQVELVAERIEVLRAKQDDEVGNARHMSRIDYICPSS